jgi:hypothetical protein
VVFRPAPCFFPKTGATSGATICTAVGVPWRLRTVSGVAMGSAGRQRERPVPGDDVIRLNCHRCKGEIEKPAAPPRAIHVRIRACGVALESIRRVAHSRQAEALQIPGSKS